NTAAGYNAGGRPFARVRAALRVRRPHRATSVLAGPDPVARPDVDLRLLLRKPARPVAARQYLHGVWGSAARPGAARLGGIRDRHQAPPRPRQDRLLVASSPRTADRLDLAVDRLRVPGWTQCFNELSALGARLLQLRCRPPGRTEPRLQPHQNKVA